MKPNYIQTTDFKCSCPTLLNLQCILQYLKIITLLIILLKLVTAVSFQRKKKQFTPIRQNITSKDR